MILGSIAGGFLVGVFARSFMPLGHAYTLFLVLLAFTAMGALFLYNRARLRSGILIAIALVACTAGIERMGAATLSGDPAINAQIGERVTLTGYVFAEPDAREDSARISIEARTLKIGGPSTSLGASSTMPVHARILATLPPHTHIAYGDEIEVSGILRLPESFDTGAGRTFNYPAYLAVSGIAYQLSSAHVDRVGDNNGNAAYTLAIRIKETFLRGLGRVLPEPESGLAGGITVGDKRSIGPELTADFQRASLVHMLVLSGYNITIVINTAAYLASRAPSFVQFGMSGFVVIFFMMISGGASSAVRAGAMALLAVYARQSKRIYLPLRVILFVAAAMTLWNPYVLAFDPSFQLSTLATIGLVAFTPIFSARMQWLTERFGMREIAASTLATQLTVLPLLLYQNGQLSLVALPANILALAPVPFAMLASCIAALGGIMFGNLATPLAFPAYALLAYIIGVTKTFGSLPFASVSISAFSVWWLWIAYAALFMIWWRVHEKSGRRV